MMLKAFITLKTGKYVTALVGLFALFYGTSTITQADTAPIRINADSVKIDENQHTSTYHGNVRLQQDSMRLEADEIRVFTSDRKLQRTVAKGKPVSFRQQKPDGGEILANASEMEYEAQSGILWLRENALIIDAENRISGKQIQYDTIKREILASTPQDEQGQVEIILDSDSLKND